MTREILCPPCGRANAQQDRGLLHFDVDGHGEFHGSVQLYAADPASGEKAEFGRWTWGILKRRPPGENKIQVIGVKTHEEFAALMAGAPPRPEAVNETIIPDDEYVCDHCNAHLKTGDRAVAFTIFFEGEDAPRWEDDFLKAEDA